MNKLIKVILISLTLIIILAGTIVKHQNKIYYIQDSQKVNDKYELLALDENGNGFKILSTDNIKDQWITGDSLKLRFTNTKDEYIYNYKLMDNN